MHKIISLKKFKDQRGVLTKVFTDTFLKENSIEAIKESYVITFQDKDIVRGEHFHKETVEIFHVLQGQCLLELVENNKLISITLNSDENKAVKIMPNTPHRFISKVANSIIIAMSTKEYFDYDKDTFAFNYDDFNYSLEN
jgi:dTDP-4-dehydrorhamnose 3,5-epimerase